MDFDGQKCNTYATFFDIATGIEPYCFFFAKIDFQFGLWRGERGQPTGYMESGSEPGYTRPSHEDGTFTTANSLKPIESPPRDLQESNPRIEEHQNPKPNLDVFMS